MKASGLLLLVVCSCMGFNIVPSFGDSTSSTGDDGGDATTATDDAEAGVTGSNCGVDPDTGVTLCLGISSCPNLTIDSDVFPGCGFRVHADPSVIDMECACYGQICPIGVASTCDQAASLMQDQSQYTVCIQINDGRCTSN